MVEYDHENMMLTSDLRYICYAQTSNSYNPRILCTNLGFNRCARNPRIARTILGLSNELREICILDNPRINMRPARHA